MTTDKVASRNITTDSTNKIIQHFMYILRICGILGITKKHFSMHYVRQSNLSHLKSESVSNNAISYTMIYTKIHYYPSRTRIYFIIKSDCTHFMQDINLSPHNTTLTQVVGFRMF